MHCIPEGPKSSKVGGGDRGQDSTLKEILGIVLLSFMLLTSIQQGQASGVDPIDLTSLQPYLDWFLVNFPHSNLLTSPALSNQSALQPHLTYTRHSTSNDGTISSVPYNCIRFLATLRLLNSACMFPPTSPKCSSVHV